MFRVYSSVAKFMEEKVCARFVAHALMIEQNQEWIASLQYLLSVTGWELKNITGDRLWCYEDYPLTKWQ